MSHNTSSPKVIIMLAVRVLLLVSVLAFWGCKEIDKDCPECIYKKVVGFAENPICNTGSSVAEWQFQGEVVYVFSEGNCGADLGASVYSKDCKSLGYLGGISGNMQINGVDFYENATKQKVIWQQD